MLQTENYQLIYERIQRMRDNRLVARVYEARRIRNRKEGANNMDQANSRNKN